MKRLFAFLKQIARNIDKAGSRIWDAITDARRFEWSTWRTDL